MIRFNAQSMAPVTAGLDTLGSSIVQALMRRSAREHEDQDRLQSRKWALEDQATGRAFTADQSQAAYDRERAAEHEKEGFTHGENEANRAVTLKGQESKAASEHDKTKAALLEHIMMARKTSAANTAKLPPDELAQAYVEAGLTAQGQNLQQITDPILGAISYKAAPYTPQQTTALKAALDRRRAARGVPPVQPGELTAMQQSMTAGLDDELAQYGISLKPDDGSGAAAPAAPGGAPAAAAGGGDLNSQRASLLQKLDADVARAGNNPAAVAKAQQIRAAIQGAQSPQDLAAVQQQFGAKGAPAPPPAALSPAAAPTAADGLPPRRGPMHRTVAPPPAAAAPAPAPMPAAELPAAAGPAPAPVDPRVQGMVQALQAAPPMPPTPAGSAAAPALAPGPVGALPNQPVSNSYVQSLMTGQAPPRPLAFGMAQHLAGLVPAPGGHYDPSTGQLIPYS